MTTTLPTTKALELDLERNGAVLRICLNRPKAYNALSTEMADELSQVLMAVRDDRTIRVLIIRGNGGTFCAGGDIKGFKNAMQGTMQADEVVGTNRLFGQLMMLVNEQPQVVVMLIEGAAIGGGLGLACVGDVTITTKDAKFRLSETSLGIPPAQIAPFVCDRVGLTQARRLMLTGARFNGTDAVGYGVAHYVVENAEALEAQCQHVLEQILLCAPNANAMTKSILFEALRRPREEALNFAAAGFTVCILSEEGREGIAAFIEKRPPKWSTDVD